MKRRNGKPSDSIKINENFVAMEKGDKVYLDFSTSKKMYYVSIDERVIFVSTVMGIAEEMFDTQ